MGKIKFHLKMIRITVARNILGLIGLFAYPFINKEKARENKSFWWLMLNDDELDNPENKPFDFDVNWAKREGIDNPKWASYRFNALRNRAYNYLKSRYPKETALDVDGYRLIEGTKGAMEWKGGAAWFYPNDSTYVLSFRYSKYFSLFFIPLKIEYGDFGDRYDFNIKKV